MHYQELTCRHLSPKTEQENACRLRRERWSSWDRIVFNEIFVQIFWEPSSASRPAPVWRLTQLFPKKTSHYSQLSLTICKTITFYQEKIKISQSREISKAFCFHKNHWPFQWLSYQWSCFGFELPYTTSVPSPYHISDLALSLNSAMWLRKTWQWYFWDLYMVSKDTVWKCQKTSYKLVYTYDI